MLNTEKQYELARILGKAFSDADKRDAVTGGHESGLIYASVYSPIAEWLESEIPGFSMVAFSFTVATVRTAFNESPAAVVFP